MTKGDCCPSHMQAILTLFELGTLDNWGDCLFAVMDITGLNRQPRQNAQWQNAIFFIVFVCVSAHFMIKSFVAVFCDQASSAPQAPSTLRVPKFDSLHTDTNLVHHFARNCQVNCTTLLLAKLKILLAIFKSVASVLHGTTYWSGSSSRRVYRSLYTGHPPPPCGGEGGGGGAQLEIILPLKLLEDAS